MRSLPEEEITYDVLYKNGLKSESLHNEESLRLSLLLSMRLSFRGIYF